MELIASRRMGVGTHFRPSPPAAEAQCDTEEPILLIDDEPVPAVLPSPVCDAKLIATCSLVFGMEPSSN